MLSNVNQSIVLMCGSTIFFFRGWTYLSFPVGGGGLRHIFGNFL